MTVKIDVKNSGNTLFLPVKINFSVTFFMASSACFFCLRIILLN